MVPVAITHKGIQYAKAGSEPLLAQTLRQCVEMLLEPGSGCVGHDDERFYATLRNVADRVMRCSERIKELCCRKRPQELTVEELRELSVSQRYNDYKQTYRVQMEQQ
jgi:hypothetical protein